MPTFAMAKPDFMQLMGFPAQWESWSMYPNELCEVQIAAYKPGNESASEHHRNGAFHWWLRQEPSAEALIKLAKLTFLDPDPQMGSDVRTHIQRAIHHNAEVASHCRPPT
jgi:hypothetical protein